MKFATKLRDTTHLTLATLQHYLGKLKIQIFCRCSVDIKENANKSHFDHLLSTVRRGYACVLPDSLRL